MYGRISEDMLFKNVSDVDAGILLEILGKKSKRTKVWTKELRHIDSTNYKPDLILDLDDENLIIEFQGTEVGDDFSRRAHSYVALTDQHKRNNKEVNLWLIIDKFVVDTLERNIICDLLGGRMSLIHEYGENKYNDGKDDGIEQGIEQGIEKIIVNLLKSGDDPSIIAKNADVSLEKVLEIKNKNEL